MASVASTEDRSAMEDPPVNLRSLEEGRSLTLVTIVEFILKNNDKLEQLKRFELIYRLTIGLSDQIEHAYPLNRAVRAEIPISSLGFGWRDRFSTFPARAYSRYAEEMATDDGEDPAESASGVSASTRTAEPQHHMTLFRNLGAYSLDKTFIALTDNVPVNRFRDRLESALVANEDLRVAMTRHKRFKPLALVYMFMDRDNIRRLREGGREAASASWELPLRAATIAEERTAEQAVSQDPSARDAQAMMDYIDRSYAECTTAEESGRHSAVFYMINAARFASSMDYLERAYPVGTSERADETNRLRQFFRGCGGLATADFPTLVRYRCIYGRIQMQPGSSDQVWTIYQRSMEALRQHLRWGRTLYKLSEALGNSPAFFWFINPEAVPSMKLMSDECVTDICNLLIPACCNELPDVLRDVWGNCLQPLLTATMSNDPERRTTIPNIRMWGVPDDTLADDNLASLFKHPSSGTTELSLTR